MQVCNVTAELSVKRILTTRAVLQLHHWQHWLLMLADQEGSSELGICSVTTVASGSSCAY